MNELASGLLAMIVLCAVVAPITVMIHEMIAARKNFPKAGESSRHAAAGAQETTGNPFYLLLCQHPHPHHPYKMTHAFPRPASQARARWVRQWTWLRSRETDDEQQRETFALSGLTPPPRSFRFQGLHASVDAFGSGPARCVRCAGPGTHYGTRPHHKM